MKLHSTLLQIALLSAATTCSCGSATTETTPDAGLAWDAAGEASSPDAGLASDAALVEPSPCTWGTLQIPRGESRCPPTGPDQVANEALLCSSDGSLLMGECVPGMICVQASPTSARCGCSNWKDTVCPFYGQCPEDPDCVDGGS